MKIATLATDRHPQITKFLREDHPTISHQFDVWHMAKGITKKLSAAAKRKECHDLLPWVKSVSNHFWWCADTCNGSATQLKVHTYCVDVIRLITQLLFYCVD